MRIDWQKTASVLFCALVAAGAIFWIGKYVVTIALPFLIAWGWPSRFSRRQKRYPRERDFRSASRPPYC